MNKDKTSSKNSSKSKEPKSKNSASKAKNPAAKKADKPVKAAKPKENSNKTKVVAKEKQPAPKKEKIVKEKVAKSSKAVASKPKHKEKPAEASLPLLELTKEQAIVNDEILPITGNAPVILQILPELKLGGVERGTIEIAKAGKKLGYEMVVASSGGHLVNQLDSAEIKHINLPLSSKNPFVIMENIRNLKKIIKDCGVDIVHARSRAPAWSAYFAAKQAKCHFMTTFHGAYSIGGPLKRWYNSVMTKGEVVIAISHFIKDHILENYKVDESKVRVVPRGVDLDQFTRDKVHKIRIINMAEMFKIELDVPVILLPARFSRWKGHEFLLDALNLIKDEKFVCVFAGYDKKHENYYRELERKVKEYDLFQKVRIIAEVKDMPALYSLSDIVVSASTQPEAFGRVSIEGQAMERMVVATNHGGSCETVKNGENGWLVESGDVEGLAATLKELLNINDKQRKSVTTKARHNIERNFSMDNMVKKTFSVYNELIGRKRS